MTLYSDRGQIIPPDLDDRTWQDYVDELRALIPKYAPTWTDQHPSDLGITLIELFAWLVEGLTYRLNRVPEKNYIAFLNLLGITRNPAVPAALFLTFEAPNGAVMVPRGNQAQTKGSETEAPIIFETDEDVLVLSTNLKVALELRDEHILVDISRTLTTPPAQGIELNIPPQQTVQLCLGFDQAVPEELTLSVKLFRPVQLDPIEPPSQPTAQVQTSWVYSTHDTQWAPLPPELIIDGTLGLQHDGLIRLSVPANWAERSPGDASPAPFFWLGLRLTNQARLATSVSVGLNYLLFNAVSAHNALTISEPELLGQSDGQPFQVFPLQHYPLFKQANQDASYSDLVVQVDGETWQLVDDFPAGAGTVYRLDPVVGELSFGDFESIDDRGGHGSIPPLSSVIVAKTYRYVLGGLSGNVGAGQVNVMRTVVTGITTVINLASSYGAADEESIDETMRQAPEMLKIRDRAVSFDDYEFLAAQCTTAVVLTRCLAPRLLNDGAPWTFGGIDRAPGNVNVIIVPDQGLEVPTPEPPKDLLYEVQQYLDKRRDITASLLVIGPRYLPIKVTLNAYVWKTAVDKGIVSGTTEVQRILIEKIRHYFHPILGGPSGQGWQIGQSVNLADLFQALMLEGSMGYIQALTITADTPLYTPPTRPPDLLTSGTLVQLADYELVCLSPNQTDADIHVEIK